MVKTMFRFNLVNCAVYLDVPEGATEDELAQAFWDWWENADASATADAVSWGDGPWLQYADSSDGTNPTVF